MILPLCALAVAYAPKLTVTSVTGKSVAVFPTRAKRGVVVFFVLAECPIANAFAPEMSRLGKEFGPQGWQFFVSYVDIDGTPLTLRKHAQAYGYPFPSLVDAKHDFVRFAGAQNSPEAAVFKRDGTLLYRGRIDDRYYALSQRRAHPRSRDLKDALTAITAGRKPATSRTQVIGCVIPTG